MRLMEGTIFMRTRAQLKARRAELQNELEKATAAYEGGRLEQKRYKGFVDRIAAETREIESESKAHEQALRYAGGTEAATAGQLMSQNFPGSSSGLINQHLQSPTMLEPQQVQQLEYAMRTKTPLTLEVGRKGWQAGVEFKSPVTESGLATPLPGIEMPNRYLSFPYEPTRLAAYLPGAAMDGPSAFWLSETAHGAEASAVVENNPKPDISPTLVNNQVKPTKLAAQFSYTLEMEQDAPGDIAGFLLNSLQRSIINQENSLLISAVSGTAGATFNGFLNTSSTLTLNATGLNGTDAIITAAAAMRTNSSGFASPDLLVLHPNTAAAILMEKATTGQYLNNLMFGAGPGGLSWNGGPDARATTTPEPGGVVPIAANGGDLHLAGIPVVQTTSIADGTGLLLSVKSGAAVYWSRLNMLIQYDPYTGLTNNTYRYVAECRFALSVPRPAAVSIISNLPL
jgi:hypothetical protein